MNDAEAYRHAAEVVNSLTYKPNWHFKLLEPSPVNPITVFRIEVDVPDVSHANHIPTTITIEHDIAPRVFAEDLVQFEEMIAVWIEHMELHEMKEWLKFNGKHWSHPDEDHAA